MVGTDSCLGNIGHRLFFPTREASQVVRHLYPALLGHFLADNTVRNGSLSLASPPYHGDDRPKFTHRRTQESHHWADKASVTIPGL